MRGIEELDHYEMLEIPRGASPGEIDRAYRLAQQTYAEGSLALYSIFEKRDAAEIRARLDEAYRVLADPELRSSYDLDHRAEPAAHAPTAQSAPAPSPASTATNGHAGPAPIASSSRFQGGLAAGAAAAVNGKASASRASVFDEADDGFDGRLDGSDDGRRHGGQHGGQHSGQHLGQHNGPHDGEFGSQYDAHEDDGRTGEFDGPRLRRTRLFRGFEIDQIADVTKVAGSHLRNIEDENYADLPADVYVRGFVTAYAKTIGLDPQAVVPSYMARLQDSRQKSQKSRFLGLR